MITLADITFSLHAMYYFRWLRQGVCIISAQHPARLAEACRRPVLGDLHTDDREAMSV